MTQAQNTNPGAADSGWKALYWISGAVSILILVLMLVSVAGYLRWPFAAGVTPTREIFDLAQTNIWAAFIALDLGLSITNIISIFLYLGLYVSLRRVNPAWALIALALGFLATSALFASRSVFEIFTLSNLYASAGSEAEKIMYLTAGETLLVRFHGAAWHTSIFLGAVASLINATLMLKSPDFSKANAWIGILTYAVNAFFWLPIVGFGLLFVAMLGSVPWFIMLASSFFRLAHQAE